MQPPLKMLYSHLLITQKTLNGPGLLVSFERHSVQTPLIISNVLPFSIVKDVLGTSLNFRVGYK